MTKKNETSTEVVTVQEAQLPVQSVQEIMSEWGDVVVESKDFIMAKVLLQQAMSESVKQRKANDGDYLNTLTDTVISDEKGEVKVLPFYCKQSYTIEKFNGKKFVFEKNVPYDGTQKPFEEDIMGSRYRNVHLYEFFCLLEEGGVPAIVPFKSTSHRTGKKLFNIMYVQNPSQNKIPANNWITLGKSEAENDGDKYFVMEFALGAPSTKEEQKECLKWIPIIKQSAFKVADEKPATQTEVKETRF